MAGFYDGVIDGVYRPWTVEAVEALQTDAGLPVTGFVDEATASHANADTVGEVTAGRRRGSRSHGGGPVGPEASGSGQERSTDIDARADLGGEGLADGPCVEPTGEVGRATLRALEEAIQPPPKLTPRRRPPRPPTGQQRRAASRPLPAEAAWPGPGVPEHLRPSPRGSPWSASPAPSGCRRGGRGGA